MSKVAFHRAFQELTEDEIATLRENSRRVEFPAGTTLIREGDNLDHIIVILEGQVDVVRLGQKGAQTKIAEPRGPGDSVGEMSFIDGLGASATLVASSDVVTRVIDRAQVDSMADKDPTFLERFYHSLLFTVIQRLRALDYAVAFPS